MTFARILMPLFCCHHVLELLKVSHDHIMIMEEPNISRNAREESVRNALDANIKLQIDLTEKAQKLEEHLKEIDRLLVRITAEVKS